MRHTIIVVEHATDFRWPVPDDCSVVTASELLNSSDRLPHTQFVNLCRKTDYMSVGYYCSLLAEAKGQAIIPGAATLVDVEHGRVRQSALDELSACLTAITAGPDSAAHKDRPLTILFGRSTDCRLQELASLAFRLFPCPILSLKLSSDRRHISSVWALSPRGLSPDHDELFIDALRNWLEEKRPRKPRGHASYRLAILHDPADPLPPSKPKTLAKFQEIGADLGIQVELVRHHDAPRLPTFDALFIRETTSVKHPSFRISRMTESLGKPVIDDPASILHCGNKVFLAELFKQNGIPIPQTIITDADRLLDAAEKLGYPVVLKMPDGCSSLGVFKAGEEQELKDVGRRLLNSSKFIIAQEYMYTPFDWRVVVLAGEPLFVCRYRMAKGHWQIFKHGAAVGEGDEGPTEGMPVAVAPRTVVDLAVQAASLIGDGLYGVDLKETEYGVFVIEVNDNPNIDVGLEDAASGDQLYVRILQEFRRRIDLGRSGKLIATMQAGRPIPHHGCCVAPAATARSPRRAHPG